MLAIYALLMQPLLLAIAGSPLAQAAALDDVSMSQLCLHNADGGPAAPSDSQQDTDHQRCVQCFACAFHLLAAPQPLSLGSANPVFRKISQARRWPGLSSPTRYSVARPRGPPLSV